MMEKSILSYLQEKGLSVQDKGAELITRCIFNTCDKDSVWKEAHLYIDAKTGQYQCKKCLAQWNMYTMMQFFWDNPKEQNIIGYSPDVVSLQPVATQKKKQLVSEKDVEKFHKALPDRIRVYLNSRGITDDIITYHQLGYGNLYGREWIVIPVRSGDGTLLFYKLRRDPERDDGEKYMFYGSSEGGARLFWEACLDNSEGEIFICEGEFDQMVLQSHWLPSVTSTWWAWTFKDEWIEKLASLTQVYICFDNDDAGMVGSEKLALKLKTRFPKMSVRRILLPTHTGKDVTEYFLQGWTIDALRGEYCESTLGVNPADFPPMYSQEIIEVLSATIKQDDINKVIVFLAFLSAFTDESQINILLNAASSSGKTYIPTEIAKYFPRSSIMDLSYVSPSALFHMAGRYDPATNEHHIDLERKILIFLDQPLPELLAKLRPLLSHDQKVLCHKIVDKNAKGGNRTKDILIYGYPTVIFCTACPNLDEQEATRFLLISPEATQEKLYASILKKIDLETNRKDARDSLVESPLRNNLIQRIEHIQNARIDDVIIEDKQAILDLFLQPGKHLHPRHQRDIGRATTLIKAFALLNFFHRKREWNYIYATQDDIDAGLALWREVGPGQQFWVSPYIMDIYQTVFLPAYEDQEWLWKDSPFSPKQGISRRAVLKKHLIVKGQSLSEHKWRQEIEPALENAWLIYAEKEWVRIYLSPTEEWKESNS